MTILKQNSAITYCCVNIKGGVRPTNQDNFYVSKTFRLPKQTGDILFCGSFPSRKNRLVAIYDGMGGESYGNIAAYLAATGTKPFDGSKYLPKVLLKELCTTLNRRICNYARKNLIQTMGTTAAIICFGKEKIYACNLGDSRIFCLRNHQILQLSEDHVLAGHCAKKPPLTQFLGIEDSEWELQPHIIALPYNRQDRFLLCSDGITDLLSEQDILSVCEKEPSAETAACALCSFALQRGGIDNITIIICQSEEDKQDTT